MIRKSFECKNCGWRGKLDFSTYRRIESEKKCPKCSSDNLVELEEMGKFGTTKHIFLIKQALLKLIDLYYVRHAKITIENHKIGLTVGGAGESHGVWASKDFYPDISASIEDVSMNSFLIDGKNYKKILVECETGKNNLLADHERITAYTLLKIQNPDLAIYLVLPSELKGKVKKPEFFNDTWYFDVPKDLKDDLIPLRPKGTEYS